LFISGTHGQEGFSGSAVQIGWMAGGGPARLSKDSGAVLVHGLVDNFYFVPDLAIAFWLLIALVEADDE